MHFITETKTLEYYVQNGISVSSYCRYVSVFINLQIATSWRVLDIKPDILYISKHMTLIYPKNQSKSSLHLNWKSQCYFFIIWIPHSCFTSCKICDSSMLPKLSSLGFIFCVCVFFCGLVIGVFVIPWFA